MIGLDTNILIRFLTRDDKAKSLRAAEIITEECTEQNPGYITSIVLTETVWTLSSYYKYSIEDIVKAIEALLRAREINFEYPDATQYAYHIYANGLADFSDALIGAIGKLNGCTYTLTFDKKASRLTEFKQA